MALFFEVMLLKKFFKIICAVLAAIILIAAGGFAIVYFTQPGLISAVYKGFTLSQEDIEKNMQENEQTLVDSINDFGFNLTLEDIQKLNDGSMSEEQMKELLLENQNITDITQDKNPEDSSGENADVPDKSDQPDGEHKENVPPNNNEAEKNQQGTNKPTPAVPQNKPSKTDKNENNVKPSADNKNNGTSQKPQTSKAESDEKVAELVAKMYVLKSTYTGQIQGIVNSMIADYKALPADQRNSTAKSNIASGYLGTISTLEAQCDAQVNAVVTELRGVLSESGQDMSLADAIVSAYAAEKESTKAYYINKYS